MGFWSGAPKDHIELKEIKSKMKHMDLSEQEQREAFSHFENEGRESFSAEHVKDVLRKMRGTAGDSLQSTHIERIGRHLNEHIESRMAPREVKEIEPTPKVVDMKEYKAMKSESLEVPPHKENREGSGSERDKAA